MVEDKEKITRVPIIGSQIRIESLAKARARESVLERLRRVLGQLNIEATIHDALFNKTAAASLRKMMAFVVHEIEEVEKEEL